MDITYKLTITGTVPYVPTIVVPIGHPLHPYRPCAEAINTHPGISAPSRNSATKRSRRIFAGRLFALPARWRVAIAAEKVMGAMARVGQISSVMMP